MMEDKSNRRCSTCGWHSIAKFEIGAICGFCYVELGLDDDLLGDFHDNPSTDNARDLVVFYQGLAETWQTFVEDREDVANWGAEIALKAENLLNKRKA
jgi:hypothetical protein